MAEYTYLPPKCRTQQCGHAPGRCMRYRSSKCISGECTHASKNLMCAVNYPQSAAH